MKTVKVTHEIKVVGDSFGPFFDRVALAVVTTYGDRQIESSTEARLVSTMESVDGQISDEDRDRILEFVESSPAVLTAKRLNLAEAFATVSPDADGTYSIRASLAKCLTELDKEEEKVRRGRRMSRT